MRLDHSMYLTAELHVFWAKCWGLKEAEWRIWSEVCIEAVERPGWQQCGYFRPWYVVMQTFTALKTYFQLISFPSRRELFEKREPYQNFLSSLIIKSLHKSLVFTIIREFSPDLMTLGGSPVNNKGWNVIAAGLVSWYRNTINVLKRYEYSKKPNKSGDVPRCDTNVENCRCFVYKVSIPADDCRSREIEVSGTLYVV